MIGANATVSVYNLQFGASTDTYPATANLTGIEAYIESKGADLVQVLGDQANLEIFDMFIDPVAIEIGAKVIDDKGREYRVSGIERHENNPDSDDLYRVTMHSEKQ